MRLALSFRCLSLGERKFLNDGGHQRSEKEVVEKTKEGMS